MHPQISATIFAPVAPEVTVSFFDNVSRSILVFLWILVLTVTVSVVAVVVTFAVSTSVSSFSNSASALIFRHVCKFCRQIGNLDIGDA